MKDTSIFDMFVQKYGRLPTEYDPDYLEMLRMSKYRILAVPDLKPGKCANCGSAKNDGRKYIDFGLEVDWYGIVFICGICLKDIALNMGLFEELQTKLQNALADIISIQILREQGVDLHNNTVRLFEEFEKYYANLYSLRSNSGVSASADVGTDTTKPNDEGSTRVNREATKTHQRATKPTSSSGSENLPSLASLLESDS